LGSQRADRTYCISMSILCYKISVASRVKSELCASVLTDVVVRAVAVHVVPEVVTELCKQCLTLLMMIMMIVGRIMMMFKKFESRKG